MTVKNSSVINYPVDYIKVFVRDRVRSKRTIRQEKEMQPVFVRMEENMIGGSTSRVVLAFEPFTAGTDKMMAIQMAGKYGDRFIELRAASHVFYKTRAIVD